jgi:hypothetical protein
VPTVIDELVLELNLDPKKLSDNARAGLDHLRRFEEAAHRSGNALEAEGKKTENFFAGLKREALAAATIFLGGRGVKEFFGYVTNLDAATGRLSKTIATNVEEVSAWQGAVKQAGGTAEGASSALAGLSGEMSQFQLTGQSAMLPVLSRLGISLYDANKNLKTSSQLWLELAGAVEGMDPRAATAFLQMIPGANQDMINFALLGRGAMEGYIRAARQAGVTTKESAEAATAYQRQIELLDASATSLGRTLTTKLAPALTGIMDIWQKTISGSDSPKSLFRIAPNSGADAVRRWWKGDGTLADNLRNSNMPGGTGQGNAVGVAREQLAQGLRDKAMPAAAGGPTSPGYTQPLGQVEGWIRKYAAEKGLDPEVMLTTARNEGLFNYKSTIPGEDSTGPFQFYHGGGLGNEFKKKTGLDAHDPSTVEEQIKFTMDHVARNGLGAFHGWKGLPYAANLGGRPGAGAAARGTPAGAAAGGGPGAGATVNIGTLQVNAPNAKDAHGIAQEVEPALTRQLDAGASNYGQN